MFNTAVGSVGSGFLAYILMQEVLRSNLDEVLAVDQGCKEWKALTDKVRDACETHGFFLLAYNKINAKSQEKVFIAVKELFYLPQETKSQYKNTDTTHGYLVYRKRPTLPLYETLGVPSASEDVHDLARVMWPQGNPKFCEVMKSVNLKMIELYFITLRMIFKGLGIENHYKSQEDKISFTLRVCKYGPLLESNESSQGVVPHKDKDIFTFLFDNGVQGLEVVSDNGSWSEVEIPMGSLIIFIGDVFEVLSNGRFKAMKHRVTMRGERERYSYVFFSFPKEGTTIEVPAELVDIDNPLNYKPIVYSDYLAAHLGDLDYNALNMFSGI